MVPDAEAALRAMHAAGYEVVLVAMAVPWVAEIALQHLLMCEIVGNSDKCPISEGNVVFCLEASEKTEVVKKMGGFVAAVERSWSICDSVLQANPDVHSILFNPDAANETAFLQDLGVTQADAYALHDLVQKYGTLQADLVVNPNKEETLSEMARLTPLIRNLEIKISSARSMVPAERLPPNTAAVLPTNFSETKNRPWLQVCDILHVPLALATQFETKKNEALQQSGNTRSKHVQFYPLAASDNELTLESLRSGKIPDGWEAIQDTETKDWFFVNHTAKTSSWLLPVHAAEDRDAALWMQRSRRNEDSNMDVGIGLTLARDGSGKVRVSALQDGSPAQKSGRIKIDDIVVAIDGVKTDQMSEEEMAKRMIGKCNTPVVLRIQHGSTLGVGDLGNKVSWKELVTQREREREREQFSSTNYN
jgi:hypothetical protein